MISLLKKSPLANLLITFVSLPSAIEKPTGSVAAFGVACSKPFWAFLYSFSKSINSFVLSVGFKFVTCPKVLLGSIFISFNFCCNCFSSSNSFCGISPSFLISWIHLSISLFIASIGPFLKLSKSFLVSPVNIVPSFWLCFISTFLPITSLSSPDCCLRTCLAFKTI